MWISSHPLPQPSFPSFFVFLSLLFLLPYPQPKPACKKFLLPIPFLSLTSIRFLRIPKLNYWWSWGGWWCISNYYPGSMYVRRTKSPLSSFLLTWLSNPGNVSQEILLLRLPQLLSDFPSNLNFLLFILWILVRSMTSSFPLHLLYTAM